MKRYKITSIIYAKSMAIAAKNFAESEVVEISLDETLGNPIEVCNRIGF